MIRLWFILSILLLFIHAEDNVLLNTHIKMIPKIMVLDLKAASKSNTATLAIVYESNRKALAQNIADEINQNYNGKVGNLNFLAMAVNVDDLLLRKDVTFVYLTSMSNRSVDKVAAWALTSSIPTFSYDLSDLERGILGSIVIERSTIIYINKNILKEGKFRFNDTLFQLARLI
ncbi:MAG: hypothetical protein PHI47_11255 [Sulfuricurvum sp.]|uniref:hypothetical protein n=1 Tax=Sulfuricurvum sp. TaxID=2025608 RepID=UPI00260D672C|nr:hypothetical protein [Sulfuricurvum sp.]MDD5160622.1 hypothetical protein [Sulfuricurvum sp.]